MQCYILDTASGHNPIADLLSIVGLGSHGVSVNPCLKGIASRVVDTNSKFLHFLLKNLLNEDVYFFGMFPSL